MFTGIVQGRGVVRALERKPGLSRITIELPPGSEHALLQGASVSVDGVCLTVSERSNKNASFDVMQETLTRTSLAGLNSGDEVNVERAAPCDAEIGGHILSGHVDCTAELISIEQPENNYVLTFAVPKPWNRYLFAKGYVALNGASLTIASITQQKDRFSVWLIPETLRLTTFANKRVGEKINLEIERATQVIVDTVERVLQERLAVLLPAEVVEHLLKDTKLLLK